MSAGSPGDSSGKYFVLGGRVGLHDQEVHDRGQDQERDHRREPGADVDPAGRVAAEVGGAADLADQVHDHRDGRGDDRGEGQAHDERHGQLHEVAAQDEVLESGHASARLAGQRDRQISRRVRPPRRRPLRRRGPPSGPGGPASRRRRRDGRCPGDRDHGDPGRHRPRRGAGPAGRRPPGRPGRPRAAGRPPRRPPGAPVSRRARGTRRRAGGRPARRSVSGAPRRRGAARVRPTTAAGSPTTPAGTLPGAYGVRRRSSWASTRPAGRSWAAVQHLGRGRSRRLGRSQRRQHRERGEHGRERATVDAARGGVPRRADASGAAWGDARSPARRSRCRRPQARQSRRSGRCGSARMTWSTSRLLAGRGLLRRRGRRLLAFEPPPDCSDGGRGRLALAAAVVAVEAGALEHHADGVEHLAQPAAAHGALGQRVVGEALELLEGVAALGAGVLVGRHPVLRRLGQDVPELVEGRLALSAFECQSYRARQNVRVTSASDPDRDRFRDWPTPARYTVYGVAGVVLLLVLALIAGAIVVRRPLPQTTGDLRLKGLDDTVQVRRDGLGVPQIYAGTSHDLFYAQGFVQAQDRFWQMDYRRHLSAGRLSELFGARTLSSDMTARTLGLVPDRRAGVPAGVGRGPRGARVLQRRRQRVAVLALRLGGVAGVHRAVGRRQLPPRALDAGRLAGLAEVHGVGPRRQRRRRDRARPALGRPRPGADRRALPVVPLRRAGADRRHPAARPSGRPAGRAAPAADQHAPCCDRWSGSPGRPARSRGPWAAATGWAATAGSSRARTRPPASRCSRTTRTSTWASRACSTRWACTAGPSTTPARTTWRGSAGPASPASRSATTTTSPGG